jgi:hypothetical protein
MEWRNELPEMVDFDRAANGEGRHRVRTRTFDLRDYARLRSAHAEASQFALAGMAYYASDDAGSVANAYKYPATSAQWGVWVDPQNLDVVVCVERAPCNNRHVRCAYPGGERSYRKDFREAVVAMA